MKGLIVKGVFYEAPQAWLVEGAVYDANSAMMQELVCEVVAVEYEESPYYDYAPVYAYADDESVIYKTMQPTLKPLEELKEIREAEAEAYYLSTDVKEFTYNDVSMWWDDELRSKLTTKANYSSGEVCVWYDGVVYTVERSVLVEMLERIELYSASCYSNLQEIKQVIDACTDGTSLLQVDVTSNYPSKLVL